ncbi:hypothetical protein GJ496_001252 [Pomphorhynchus laevis]|nr:hypothetical protein GJ496_003293 [Pomphorhynchus laevis]KAI0985052.1 hypothetical protein GJ496_001252 [Pomphorhynchus laevis]
MCTSENAYFVSEHQSSYGNVPVINDSAGITNGKGKVPSPTSFPSDLQKWLKNQHYTDRHNEKIDYWLFDFIYPQSETIGHLYIVTPTIEVGTKGFEGYSNMASDWDKPVLTLANYDRHYLMPSCSNSCCTTYRIEISVQSTQLQPIPKRHILELYLDLD